MALTSLTTDPTIHGRPTLLRVVRTHTDPAADQRPGPDASTGPTWAARLSGREHEVLQLLALGLSNAEIARELVISVPTVKVHVAHLLRKTRARDRLQLVVKVYRSGYVQA